MGIVRHVNIGFSIMELLVVLTIIGLMVSVVPAYFSKGVSGAEFKGAARNLSASLRSARAHAISRHEDITVTFNIEEKTYQISGDKKTYKFPQEVEIKVENDQVNQWGEPSARIQFYADGGSSGGKIQLTKGESAEYNLRVDWLTGQVKILP